MNPKVLLVEDEPDVRLIARAALARSGFEVLTAATGIEALGAVASEVPDLIVLDCMLPELDGFEICTRLKLDPATRSIPVVFLTGGTRNADRERCLALGALGYIPKPFNPLTLGAQVMALWQNTLPGRGEAACS